MAFEKVEVPLASYVGWGSKSGQHVTGKVLDYDETGGTDFNGDPVPYVEIELTERAASFNKAGERRDYEAGDAVAVSGSQTNLKKALKRAELKRGYTVKILMTGEVAVDKGKAKQFEIYVDKSTASASTNGQAAVNDNDEPPF